MHQARKIVFLVLLAAALASRAGAESPYRRSWSKDGWIAGGSAAGGRRRHARQPDAEPLTGRRSPDCRANRSTRSTGARPGTIPKPRATRATRSRRGRAAPLALLLDRRVREDWETCALMYAETMALAVILPAIASTRWIGSARSSTIRTRRWTRKRRATRRSPSSRGTRRWLSPRPCSCPWCTGIITPVRRRDPTSGRGRFSRRRGSDSRYESGEHFPTDIITGAVADAPRDISSREFTASRGKAESPARLHGLPARPRPRAETKCAAPKRAHRPGSNDQNGSGTSISVFATMSMTMQPSHANTR